MGLSTEQAVWQRWLWRRYEWWRRLLIACTIRYTVRLYGIVVILFIWNTIMANILFRYLRIHHLVSYMYTIYVCPSLTQQRIGSPVGHCIPNYLLLFFLFPFLSLSLLSKNNNIMEQQPANQDNIDPRDNNDMDVSHLAPLVAATLRDWVFRGRDCRESSSSWGKRCLAPSSHCFHLYPCPTTLHEMPPKQLSLLRATFFTMDLTKEAPSCQLNWRQRQCASL